ncbi:lysozyme inhibitor LprI family protein [Domibacillus indicus]|uniref:lysozyme inhibitor LprI family protein n=1 Tax=Domibacillus indicus TaxID=1437523 RepID=UPI0006961347|nr:lysozyme inhibitor LprI family protein [Domibacillus indicus]
MKKKAAMLLAAFMLAGCGNGLYDQSMEQGKLALAGGEFDKALASFELALEEKPDDKEAEAVYKQLSAYKNIEAAAEQAQWDQVVEEGNALIKEKELGKSLKKPVEQFIHTAQAAKENEQLAAEKVDTAKQLAEDKKYEEAQEVIDEIKQDENLQAAYAGFASEVDKIAADIQSGQQNEAEAEKEAAVQAAEEAAAAVAVSQKTTYYQKLDRIERGLADLDYIYETGTTVEIREAETERYKRWDDALNEIYGVLKKELPSGEMEQLRQAQREWIKFRDETAEEAASSFSGGSWESVQYKSTQADVTRNRCYELVDRYMD